MRELLRAGLECFDEGPCTFMNDVDDVNNDYQCIKSDNETIFWYDLVCVFGLAVYSDDCESSRESPCATS